MVLRGDRIRRVPAGQGTVTGSGAAGPGLAGNDARRPDAGAGRLGPPPAESRRRPARAGPGLDDRLRPGMQAPGAEQRVQFRDRPGRDPYVAHGAELEAVPPRSLRRHARLGRARPLPDAGPRRRARLAVPVLRARPGLGVRAGSAPPAAAGAGERRDRVSSREVKCESHAASAARARYQHRRAHGLASDAGRDGKRRRSDEPRHEKPGRRLCARGTATREPAGGPPLPVGPHRSPAARARGRRAPAVRLCA